MRMCIRRMFMQMYKCLCEYSRKPELKTHKMSLLSLSLSLCPKGSMYPNSIHLSLKVVSILVLWGQSIYYLGTWILWVCVCLGRLGRRDGLMKQSSCLGIDSKGSGTYKGAFKASLRGF